MKKQYACPECYYIHSTKPVRVRVDIDKVIPHARFGSRTCSHGWRTYRQCPECGHKLPYVSNYVKKMRFEVKPKMSIIVN